MPSLPSIITDCPLCEAIYRYETDRDSVAPCFGRDGGYAMPATTLAACRHTIEEKATRVGQLLDIEEAMNHVSKEAKR